MPPSPRENVAASDVQLAWGNWLCAPDPMSIENFNAVMYRLADVSPEGSPAGSACPQLGDPITLASYGEQTWGDEDCDDDIDEIDALTLLLWYADLDEGNNDCPDLGDSVEEAGPQAEWEADESGFETLGPYQANANGSVNAEGTVNLSQNPTLIREDFYAHNNGPEESQALVTFETVVTQGDVFIRWISQSQCLTPDDENIPCGEANNGQQTDTCLDGLDNDNDQASDGYDTDCVEVRKMGQGALQSPNSGGSVYDRYLTVTCLNPGPVEIEFRNVVYTLPPAEDPDLTNNQSSVTLTGECFFSKGGSASDPARPYSGPGPYLPAALPQSGGPPEPR